MTSEPAPQQTWSVAEPYLNLRCGLGEGPYYEPATNSLRFVDIKKQRLHTVSLDEGGAGPAATVTTLQLDTPIAVTADVDGADPREKLLIGAKYGIALLDRSSGTYEYVTRFHTAGGDNERIRANDGAVDPHGRFWLGTMTDFGVGPFEREGEGNPLSPPPLPHRRGSSSPSSPLYLP